MKLTHLLATTGAFVLAGAVAMSTPMSAVAANPVTATLDFDDAGCKYHCRDCGTVQNPYHDIVTHWQTNNEWSAHLENCGPGDCDDHDCPTEPGDSGPIHPDSGTVTVGESQSTEALLETLRAHAGRVKYNAERESVQVYCRAGQLVANLPLTKTQAAELNQALSGGLREH